MTSEEFRTNPLFLRNQFKTDGVFEIPKIEKEEISLENVELIGYDKLRDSERFVKGSDEKIYYTPDHYDTFYEIIS